MTTDQEIINAVIPVKRKKMMEMSKEEKDKIIADIKSGKDHEHYDIKIFANGNCRLINKKTKTPLQKASSDDNNSPEISKLIKNNNPIKLTNDMWVIQNIIDLKTENALINKKYKKLKKELRGSYVTEEVDEISEPVQVQTPQEPIHEEQQVYEELDIIPEQIQQQKICRHLLRRR